jgi:hypothetical protein
MKGRPISVGKSEGNWVLIHKRRCEKTIWKWILKRVEWINPAQDDFQWQIVNTTSNLWVIAQLDRFQWPRGLKAWVCVRSLAAIVGSNPTASWMSVSCDCCLLSGTSPCVGLITRPEQSYRVWCVWVWSWSLYNEEAQAHWGLLRHGGKNTQRTD